MNATTKQWIAWATVSIVLTLVAIFLGVKYPAPPQPEEPVVALGTTHFSAIEAEDLTATDDVVVGDEAEIDGAATLGTVLVASRQTTVTVSAGSIITPTGLYQPISSSGFVTTATDVPIAAGAIGQLLIIENVNASDMITIDGAGGTVECKADVQLAAGDTVLMIYDGADWTCLSTYDN